MNRRDLFKTAAAAAALPVAAAQTPPAAWKPSVFDDHQNRTVVAVIDLIIPDTDTPGAKAALVNRHMDLALRDGDVSLREQFLQGLSALDGHAIQTHGHPFATCSRERQVAMLTARQDTPFFRLAKAMTSRLYYATQPGFRELNKGGRVPSKLGCQHGSHA